MELTPHERAQVGQIGGWQDDLVEPLERAVSAAAAAVGGPLPLALGAAVRGFGRPPRVWALPVEDRSGRLVALVGDLTRRLVDLNPSFRPDPRPYSPHVTVFRNPGGPPRGIPPAGPLSFTARTVSLIRSDLGPGGSRYTALTRADLDPTPHDTAVPATAGDPA